jgi:hypothetical protein
MVQKICLNHPSLTVKKQKLKPSSLPLKNDIMRQTKRILIQHLKAWDFKQMRGLLNANWIISKGVMILMKNSWEGLRNKIRMQINQILKWKNSIWATVVRIFKHTLISKLQTTLILMTLVTIKMVSLTKVISKIGLSNFKLNTPSSLKKRACTFLRKVTMTTLW